MLSVLHVLASQKDLLSELSNISIITSPVGAVAKYCDEYVCLCVCLSVCKDISGITWAIFTKFFVHVSYVHSLVLLRLVDNRLHCLSAGKGVMGVHSVGEL